MNASAHASTPVKPPPWSPPDPLPERLQTERLVIRPYVPGDAPALFEAIDSSRQTLLPWLPWAASQHKTVEASLASIELFARVRASRPMSPEDNAVFGYVMGIFERTADGSAGRLLGGTGFNRILHDWHDAETGYWLRADARGRGYCTEAVRALITWGLRSQAAGGWGFRRIRIFAAAENVASAAVPRRLGLRGEGRFVRDRWVDGYGWCDTLAWAVLAGEPLADS